MQTPVDGLEFSEEPQFSQIEKRILNWLDQREIFMAEPVFGKFAHEKRGKNPVIIKLNSDLFLSRKKKS